MARLSIYTTSIAAALALLAAGAAAEPFFGLRGSPRGGRRLEEKNTFYNPQYNGLRVDYCYSEMKGFFDGCGQQAADAFCMAMKYRGAIAFTKQEGVTEPTIHLLQVRRGRRGSDCTG